MRPIEIAVRYLDEATKPAPDQKYSHDRFELLLEEEGHEVVKTKYGDCSMAEIESAIRVFDRLLPNGDYQMQPLVCPLLADGSSQFPQAEFAKGF